MNTYKYITQENTANSQKIVVKNQQDEVITTFYVYSKYTKKLLSKLKAHENLIESPKVLNLFEIESIESHIKDIWLLPKKLNHSILEFVQTDIFLEYRGKHISDEEILQNILNANPCIHHIENISSYKEDLLQIRKQFNMKRKVSIDLDTFIGLSGELLLSSLLSTEISLRAVAFEMKNATLFQKRVLSLCNKKEKSLIFEKDGYRALLVWKNNSPILTIQYAGICLHFNNLMHKDIPTYKEILVLEGMVFWEDVWYELVRLHTIFLEREQEILNKKIKVLEKRIQCSIAQDHSRKKLDMSFDILAKEYEKYTGKKYSATTMATVFKKGLSKMQKYFKDTSLNFEDLVCA